METQHYHFTKADYKNVRRLLSLALEREFIMGLEKVEAMIQEWRAERPESSREWYHKVLEEHKAHRKQLARTYDDNSKFTQEMSLISLLVHEILKMEDLEGCSPGMIASLKRDVERRKY